jgi:uncharacterized protein YdeI (YjbR/CyaY-like superfamily)
MLAEQGKEIKPDLDKPLMITTKLKMALATNPKTKSRFDKLSKSKRREYTDYIRAAKKQETRSRRIEKIMPMIIESVGLNDKYRK